MCPSPQPERLRLSSAADLVAVVPYLMGFHPADSVVLVGFGDRTVRFVARVDLPEPDDPGPPRQLAEVADRQAIDEVALVGYGPLARVDPAVLELCVRLEEIGLPVREALRVTDGRYWSYVCGNPQCCPPEGTPFQVETSPVALSAVVAGCVALPDRAAMEQRVASVVGAEREAFAAATAHAEHRISKAFISGDQALVRARLVRAGAGLLDRALRRYQNGGRLGDPAAAWLSVLLAEERFASVAWQRVDRTGAVAHIAMWCDLTRRVESAYLPPVATLLGYAAWRTGDGALAGIAVQRALDASPTYEPAQVMQALLDTGTPPDALFDTVAVGR
jgi:hypothetical protein